MSVVSVIEQRIADFAIAQAPAGAVERARLKAFVAVRLGLSAVLMIAAPVWLLAVAPPPLWQCAAFAALLAPVAAIFALSRGASLDTAQIVSVGGLLAFAAALACGGAAFVALAFVAALLAVLEAASSSNMRLVLATAALAGAGVAVVAFSNVSTAGPTLIGAALAAVLAAMIAYACALGWSMAFVGAIAMYGERRETLRHEALAQTIGDLVLRQDRDGSVVYASNEALAMFGLSPRELMGRGLFERIHVADRPTFLSAIADALAGNATATCQVRLRRGALNEQDAAVAEPSFAWIELRAHNLPQERRATDPNDRAAVVSIVRDVTRQRQAEEDIIHAREHAEQANVWKDRFLANVSHELRTPLNAIIGFAEILTNEEIVPTDAARRKEYAQIIHSSGHHLLEVVNSILDVSKIDAGSFDIVTEPFSLPPLLDQCCDMIGLKATQAQVEIVRDYPRAMDEIVADKRACKQIVINLMSNAVKFTPAGGRVTLSARPEGNNFVLSVSDTGIGIAAKDLGHIGDPFFQAHNSTTRPYEGTGLGLSLVRGLVGLHGGAISVESVVGQGTTVTISLPAHCTTAHGGSRLAKIETFARRGGAPSLEPAHHEPVRKIA
ncbi:MAG: PAS domain-containing sensor histidine kinase [Rhodoblastus sp.]|nr:PAS domain-containing sensor histidine kinase [Rhodoblastus sp.]